MLPFFWPCFFGAGGGAVSHPGVLETSNSGAAAAGLRAGLAVGRAAAGLAKGVATPAVPAPAAAAAIFALGADGAGLEAAVALAAVLAAGAGFALPSASGAFPRPRAYSTEARRSTSMRNGCPDEYSAWNITFHDLQIIRRLSIGSCSEKSARPQ